jgi:hypothetical protein
MTTAMDAVNTANANMQSDAAAQEANNQNTRTYNLATMISDAGAKRISIFAQSSKAALSDVGR